MMIKKYLIVLLVAAVSCNTSSQEKETPETRAWKPDFQEIQSVAGQDSFYPRLSASANSAELLLSWYHKNSGDTTMLYTAALANGKWMAPALVAEGNNWFVNWADFPNLSAYGNGHRAISYLPKSGEGLFAYDVRLKLYDPATGKWVVTLSPHRDGTETEHGFVSMAPMSENSLGLIWLDGRKYAEGGGGSHDGEHHGGSGAAMSLRFARILEEGNLSEEQELDARTCDCCQTAIAATESGLIAVYRDRSDEEIRDISYIRYENGQWSQAKNLHADKWEIKGCPVNGPAVAVQAKDVAVAWFTGAEEKNKVQLIRSQNEGTDWNEPILIDDKKPIGRVDVAQLPDGSTVVSWLANGNKFRLKRIHQDGSLMGEATIATVEGGRSSGFPQLELYQDELYVAWTEIGEHKSIKLAKSAL